MTFDVKAWVAKLPTEEEFDAEINRIDCERDKKGKIWVAAREKRDLELRKVKKEDVEQDKLEL